MKKVNENEMRNTEGGWYFGKVYCSMCGRDVTNKIPYIDKVLYSKTGLVYRYSGWNDIWGNHYHS